ncbi:MAG: DUF2911 domain-containing protein [Thermoanaerobaculia bacterium]
MIRWTAIAVIAASGLLAQTPQSGEKKPLSPPATAQATIDGSRIVVNYSAPSMRGRRIMGGLVPWSKVWRTGANSATTLITQADLRIGELAVPKGTYTLYSIPSESGWILIVNRQTGQWGTQYDETQDLGRVPMKVRMLKDPVETFQIAIEPKGPRAGALKLIWENTEASVPLALD